MAQWGSVDNTSNSVLWAPAQYGQTPNTANRDAMFGNTTAGAYATGTTTGVYGVDAVEVHVGSQGITHTGWVRRTTGTGGRTGRIQHEVLVAGGISGDASDDAVFPDA